MFVFAIAMWAWQIRRLAVANPTSRLPYLGWPPKKPRYVVVLSALAAGLIAAAGVLIAHRADGAMQWWFYATCLLVALGFSVAQATHNRGLPH
jgi:hypothetical protein